MDRRSLPSSAAQYALLFAGVLVTQWLPAAAHAQAQAVEQQPAPRAGQLPRRLHGGAPARRFPTKTQAKSASSLAARPTPAPSISLGAAELPGRPSARRSEALLQREIALLQRLLANTQLNDMRRPDILLRLSLAYQELMWLQKQRLHALLTP